MPADGVLDIICAYALRTSEWVWGCLSVAHMLLSQLTLTIHHALYPKGVSNSINQYESLYMTTKGSAQQQWVTRAYLTTPLERRENIHPAAATACAAVFVFEAIIGGMSSLEGGCDVADCGLCTTPAMFMVRHKKNYRR